MANRKAMSENTISVRIPSEKKAALDVIATQTGRYVSVAIEEAVNAYLDLHAWQCRHIEEGVRQADAGEFASEAEVREAYAGWRGSARGSPGTSSTPEKAARSAGRSVTSGRDTL